jgi:UDP-glucose 6-dehydrogenase
LQNKLFYGVVFLGRKEMAEFAEKFNLDIKQVRTRIVNTRRVKQKFKEKTIALLGIDES